MADLKTMTVRALRDLARRHIGPGYSKLKTKSELLTALDRVMPRAVLDALQPPTEAELEENGETLPAGEEAALETAAPAIAPAPPVAPALRAAAVEPVELGAEPDPEGHLVARVAGEQAVRHAEIPMIEEKVPPQTAATPTPDFDEQLGELSDDYGEDLVVLLPKDPRALYLYWDFARETVDRAFAWMQGPHTKVRLYADGEIAREQDFTLESRSWYFHSLEPGRAYRAELMCFSTDGQVRRIGPPSNTMRLPTEGPSPIIDDRFIRIPFDVPAGRLAEAMRQAAEVRGAPPPFEEASRERLYEMSGGSARAIGSSEQVPEGPAGPGGPGGGEGGSPARTGAPRSSGPWPWSGTLPRRSS